MTEQQLLLVALERLEHRIEAQTKATEDQTLVMERLIEVIQSQEEPAIEDEDEDSPLIYLDGSKVL